MHERLCGSKSSLTLHKIINKPDFPPSADDIADPCPDMNNKVAAFTVGKKSIYTVHSLYNTPHYNMDFDITRSCCFWFGLLLYVPVNSYGHFRTVCSPNPGQIPYFRGD